MRDKGVAAEDIRNYIAIIGTYQHLGHKVAGMGGSQITRPLIIVKKQPFDQTVAEALFASAGGIQQTPVHIPYVFDHYQPLEEMLAKQKVDLTAKRDDKPFFYHKTKALPVTLIITLIVTLLLAWLIARQKSFAIGHAVYFSGIAIGFMFIEITLIQKFILPMGHPTLSFVLVLGVLLTAGGLGSYFSKKWDFTRHKRFVPLLLVGMIKASSKKPGTAHCLCLQKRINSGLKSRKPSKEPDKVNGDFRHLIGVQQNRLGPSMRRPIANPDI